MCKTSRGGGGGGSERPHASDLFSYGVCARGRHDTNGGPVGAGSGSVWDGQNPRTPQPFLTREGRSARAGPVGAGLGLGTRKIKTRGRAGGPPGPPRPKGRFALPQATRQTAVY